MEFSYKLTESEYLFAHKIATKRPAVRSTRVLANAFALVQLIVIWGAFVAGMALERSDMAGIVAGSVKTSQQIRPILFASFAPGFAYASLSLVIFRISAKWLNKHLRRQVFEGNPGCQAETTVEANSERISFRSATGSYDSIWECYCGWSERSGIVILVTKAGVRQILKIADLPEPERKEFCGILAAALPMM